MWSAELDIDEVRDARIARAGNERLSESFKSAGFFTRQEAKLGTISCVRRRG